jgi:hypothetical protein
MLGWYSAALTLWPYHWISLVHPASRQLDEVRARRSFDQPLRARIISKKSLSDRARDRDLIQHQQRCLVVVLFGRVGELRSFVRGLGRGAPPNLLRFARPIPPRIF